MAGEDGAKRGVCKCNAFQTGRRRWSRVSYRSNRMLACESLGGGVPGADRNGSNQPQPASAISQRSRGCRHKFTLCSETGRRVQKGVPALLHRSVLLHMHRTVTHLPFFSSKTLIISSSGGPEGMKINCYYISPFPSKLRSFPIPWTCDSLGSCWLVGDCEDRICIQGHWLQYLADEGWLMQFRVRIEDLNRYFGIWGLILIKSYLWLGKVVFLSVHQSRWKIGKWFSSPLIWE